MEQDKPKRKPGPAAGPPTMKTTVMLDVDDADWAKKQPGGLSSLLRQLLREAHGASKTKRDS